MRKNPTLCTSFSDSRTQEAWTSSLHGVANVSAATAAGERTLTLTAPIHNAPLVVSAGGSQFEVMNALEELDELGEFYVDVKSGMR